jgi:hypothetical protein
MTQKLITADAEVWVDLSEWNDDEIKEEYLSRHGSPATPNDLLYYWIKDQNPPQLVRDWVWEIFGRVL